MVFADLHYLQCYSQPDGEKKTHEGSLWEGPPECLDQSQEFSDTSQTLHSFSFDKNS